MDGAVIIPVVVCVVIVLVALGVWMLDARRNQEVEQDEERLDPEPGLDTDPDQPPLHRRDG